MERGKKALSHRGSKTILPINAILILEMIVRIILINSLIWSNFIFQLTRQ